MGLLLIIFAGIATLGACKEDADHCTVEAVPFSEKLWTPNLWIRSEFLLFGGQKFPDGPLHIIVERPPLLQVTDKKIAVCINGNLLALIGSNFPISLDVNLTNGNVLLTAAVVSENIRPVTASIAVTIGDSNVEHEKEAQIVSHLLSSTPISEPQDSFDICSTTVDFYQVPQLSYFGLWYDFEWLMFSGSKNNDSTMTLIINSPFGPEEQARSDNSSVGICLNGVSMGYFSGIFPVVFNLSASNGWLQLVVQVFNPVHETRVIGVSIGFFPSMHHSNITSIDTESNVLNFSLVSDGSEKLQVDAVTMAPISQTSKGHSDMVPPHVHAYIENMPSFVGDIPVNNLRKILFILFATMKLYYPFLSAFVIDIGANRGQGADFSCNTFAPPNHSFVLYFEANSNLTETLVAKATQCKSIVVSEAVSDTVGPVHFFNNMPNNAEDEEHGGLGNGASEPKLAFFHYKDDGPVQITSTTLDQYFISNENELKPYLDAAGGYVTFMKIDIEGYDARALKGGRGVLNRTRMIQFECSELMEYFSPSIGLKFAVDLLDELDFDIMILGFPKTIRIGGGCWNDNFRSMAVWRNCFAINRRVNYYDIVTHALGLTPGSCI